MIDLRQGDWRDVLADVEQVDSVIVDPPYSEKTHVGHNYTHAITGGKTNWKKIGFDPFIPDDVHALVSSLSSRCRGWFVVLSDDILAPIWANALSRAERYVFAPLPYVAPGSRCRLHGDGPSAWTIWIIVARPKNKEFSTWGTLPGAYILPKGHGEKMIVTGGKPLWLMRHLVRDYTRPGDLVCDPCAGGATTLIAAAEQGRRAVGSEIDPDTFAKAQLRIKSGFTPDLFGGAA